MQQTPTERMAAEWQALIERFPDSLFQEMQTLAHASAPELAELFYSEMLADPHSACFLSHDQVKDHLNQSMQNWICSLLSVSSSQDLLSVIEYQKHIGHVHARIEIPVSLVLRGARLLKGRLTELIDRQPDPILRHDMARIGGEYIDMALEVMCFAFSQSHDRNSRAEEAYRLFSVSQNIGAEKEHQRAALLDWENKLMFELATGSTAENLPPLASSEFGLWFRHKASHAFQGAPESSNILQLIEEIDQDLENLAKGGRDQRRHHLRQVHEHIRSIKYLLDSLLDQAKDLEAGRDVLTRLLNRKFLPVVLGKELLYSRQSGHSFAVLVLDIDHFKQINDTYGHDAGDLVLQQMASLLSSNTRGGDYAFRLGGEEFLVILVDIVAEKAMQVAEKLRKLIAVERIRLPQGAELSLTVSIGIALYDGHPDYQRLLQRADQALYKAKNAGRNRCEWSE